ncbi:ABC transporter substrate-binding protein [Tumebacillus algifaecis]|uniref:ABC transporter substrate-binding protein n=2 Tax=Tumebacillus algifaecis TaxID=1214604 RepID=A0A223D6Y5_9BACL|nr:ABC transporter substrate-binding protein [Tumebacillus algifaecis]
MNRLKKSGFTMFTVLLSSMLILSGCGTKSEEQPGAEPAKQEVKYTVKHSMGETPIEGTPKRVVVLTNEGTEALLSMGVKPVGAVKSWTGDPWYAHIKSEMEGVQVVGDESQPNLEAIAALKPDLILGNKMRQEKVYEQLKAIAPTVFSEDLRGNWKINYKLYAEALNKKDEGDKQLAAWDKRIAEFKEKAGDKLKTEVSMVRFMAGKTRLYLNNTFSGIIFKELGLARPAAQNKEDFVAEIGKERMPEMEGDIMFYFTYDTGNGEGTKTEQEWMNDNLFKNLNVVKAGKAHRVDDAIWNTAGGIKAANLLLDDLSTYILK